MTTLYFETDHEDDLRRTGFSKEGRHHNPQVILGLLMSAGGYPLAYTVQDGNQYEGRTMIPVVREFVEKFGIDISDFIVVADSGLMNSTNIAELDRLGYKYIIEARIKNEPTAIKDKIMQCPRENGPFVSVPKGKVGRLLYSDGRDGKDSHNRTKGVKKLEKAYGSGRLTKDKVNKRGYNKFMEIDRDVKVKIDYAKSRRTANGTG